MKKRIYQLMLALAIVATLSACSSNEVPLTESEITATLEISATEAAVEVDKNRSERIGKLNDLVKKQGLEGVVVDEKIPEQGHDNFITYPWNSLPPTGGTHNGTWQKCGIYEKPVYAHHAIHAMEHGAVWITYHPDLNESSIATLEKSAQQSAVLLSPYYGQTEDIVLTAWGLQYVAESADDPKIEKFLDTFRNGLQTMEPGATCAQGTTVVAEAVDGAVTAPTDGESMDTIPVE